jgi:hypothetical protein
MIERGGNKDNSLGKFLPCIYDAKDAFDSGQITLRGENYIIKLPEGEKEITPDHFYDLLPATMFGLNQALVRAESGIKLREIFQHELTKYETSMEENGGNTFGAFVYYPYDEELVHFAPRPLHKLALLACNSSLLMDSERKLDYDQIRNIFDHVVPAIAGLSVGSNIGWSIIENIRPDTIKVSDPALFKLTNANRIVGLEYRDLVMAGNKANSSAVYLYGLREKQEVFTANVLAQDPYMSVFSYKGIDGGNVRRFLGGGGGEPKATIVIDVCDSLDVKMQLAQEARKQGIRLLRFSDAGSTVRVDIRPFDTNPNAPLAYGISDDDLNDLFVKAGASEIGFFDFAAGLIGKDFLERGDEFGDLVTGKISKHYSSVPQIGSTALMTGGIAGEIIARMSLGFRYPERFIMDMVNLKFESWGEAV